MEVPELFKIQNRAHLFIVCLSFFSQNIFEMDKDKEPKEPPAVPVMYMNSAPELLTDLLWRSYKSTSTPFSLSFFKSPYENGTSHQLYPPPSYYLQHDLFVSLKKDLRSYSLLEKFIGVAMRPHICVFMYTRLMSTKIHAAYSKYIWHLECKSPNLINALNNIWVIVMTAGCKVPWMWFLMFPACVRQMRPEREIAAMHITLLKIHILILVVSFIVSLILPSWMLILMANICSVTAGEYTWKYGIVIDAINLLVLSLVSIDDGYLSGFMGAHIIVCYFVILNRVAFTSGFSEALDKFAQFPPITTVIVTDVDSTSLSLRWLCNECPDVKLDQFEYNVELNGIMIGKTKGRQAVVVDLNPGERYRIRVFAVNSDYWTPSLPVYVKAYSSPTKSDRVRILNRPSLLPSVEIKSDSVTEAERGVLARRLSREKEMEILDEQVQIARRERITAEEACAEEQRRFDAEMTTLNAEILKYTSTETPPEYQTIKTTYKVLEDQRKAADTVRIKLQKQLTALLDKQAELQEETQDKTDDTERAKTERKRLMNELINEKARFDTNLEQINQDILRTEQRSNETLSFIERKRKDLSNLESDSTRKSEQLADLIVKNEKLDSTILENATEIDRQESEINALLSEHDRMQSSLFKLAEEHDHVVEQIETIKKKMPKVMSNAERREFEKIAEFQRPPRNAREMILREENDSFEEILDVANHWLENESESEDALEPEYNLFGPKCNARDRILKPSSVTQSIWQTQKSSGSYQNQSSIGSEVKKASQTTFPESDNNSFFSTSLFRK